MSHHPAPTRLILPFTLLTLLLLPTLSLPPSDIRVSTPDHRLIGRPTVNKPRTRITPTQRKLPFALRPLNPPSKPVRPKTPPTRPSTPITCNRRYILTTLHCFCRLSSKQLNTAALYKPRCAPTLKTLSPKERSSTPCRNFRRLTNTKPTVAFLKHHASRVVSLCSPVRKTNVVLRQGIDFERLRDYIDLLTALSNIVDSIFIPSNAPSRFVVVKKAVKGDKVMRLKQYNNIKAP